MHIRTAEISDAYIIGHIQYFSWKTMFRDSGVDATDYLAEFNSEDRAKAWQELLTSETDPIILVAESLDGHVCGFVYGKQIEPTPEWPYASELVAIHVLPKERRQGIGRALIAAFAEQVKHRVLSSMCLWTLAGNPARGLYDRLQGKVIDQRRIEIGKHDVMITIDEVAYGWTDLAPLLGAAF